MTSHLSGVVVSQLCLKQSSSQSFCLVFVLVLPLFAQSIFLAHSILFCQSFSLTFSLSIWLSHCCVVNVSLCLTLSCSVNHFSRPFSATLASTCPVNGLTHSGFVSFFHSFRLFASILCCPSSSLTLVLAILVLTCSQWILVSPHCVVNRSHSLTHSLTHLLSIFFSRLFFKLCCHKFCAVNVFFSRLFCHSSFPHSLFDHCCCFILVL